VRSARRYASESGARLVELADAGHLLPMQRPVEVAVAIAAALTSASSGAR
jgi:pimeloyl-ACP methyl ester carboxylesterase